MKTSNEIQLETREIDPLDTPTDLSHDAVRELRSIGDISRHQRLKDNNDEFVTPKAMMSELSGDNLELTRSLRFTHQICDRNNDVASASLIETWIDQTERRTWFLSETARQL